MRPDGPDAFAGGIRGGNRSRRQSTMFWAQNAISALLFLIPALPAFAVEGGMSAYLLGSRSSLAGIVPGPGTYAALDLVHSEGSVKGLSLGGLPIRADSTLKLSFAKFSVTHVLDASLWGGTPAFNLNVPYVIDANLSYIGVTPPFDGVPVTDTTDGLGDITVTGLLGWHQGNLHYSAAFSVFAPTGSYETASVDVRNRTINALNTGKNIWTFQPVFSLTHFDPETGLEFSGAASLMLSTRNSATDYQNAPAVTLEGTVMQHLKSGWAFGASGYAYAQTGDDSGAGAEATKAFLEADSLRAQVFGIGPIITYSGATVFGKSLSLQFKYFREFGAKRRFENDTLWLNAALTF